MAELNQFLKKGGVTSVQRGVTSVLRGTTTNVTISAISLSTAYLKIGTTFYGNDATNADNRITARLSSPTNIEFVMNSGGFLASEEVMWEVISG